MQMLASPESRVQVIIVDESGDVLERLPGAYKADGEILTIFIDDRVRLSLPIQALREAGSGNGGKMEPSSMGGDEEAYAELMKRARRPNAMLFAFDFDGKTRTFRLQLNGY